VHNRNKDATGIEIEKGRLVCKRRVAPIPKCSLGDPPAQHRLVTVKDLWHQLLKVPLGTQHRLVEQNPTEVATTTDLMYSFSSIHAGASHVWYHNMHVYIAGIGYFTLPYLVHAGASHVYACEWNPNAVEALQKNLSLNSVSDRCTVLFGDNRQVCISLDFSLICNKLKKINH